MERKVFPLVCTIVIFSAMLASGCMAPLGEKSVLEIGRPAPSFKLPDLNGRQVSLEQYKGKVVILDFWATWCGPCRIAMPLLENLQKEYANNMVLLAINLQESRETVREFLRQEGLNPYVLLDEQGSLTEAYGTETIPMQVLIDKEGIVRDVKNGFHPRMISQLRAEVAQLR
jgi:thiol-disulfide isomerase/thioredoxin